MAFERLKDLGEDRFLKIKNDLARGVSAMAVARTIQQEWGQLNDVAEKTLTQQVNRLRLQMAEGVFGETLKEELQSTATALAPEVQRILRGTPNVMEKLGDVIFLQEARIKRLAEKEKAMPLPMTALNAVINDYVDQLGTLQKLRFELGLDEFHSTQQPSLVGRGVITSTTLPDGTNVQKQAYEAYETANRLLAKHGA
jgi:uncharacterized protein YPO0396